MPCTLDKHPQCGTSCRPREQRLSHRTLLLAVVHVLPSSHEGSWGLLAIHSKRLSRTPNDRLYIIRREVILTLNLGITTRSAISRPDVDVLRAGLIILICSVSQCVSI